MKREDFRHDEIGRTYLGLYNEQGDKIKNCRCYIHSICVQLMKDPVQWADYRFYSLGHTIDLPDPQRLNPKKGLTFVKPFLQSP